MDHMTCRILKAVLVAAIALAGAQSALASADGVLLNEPELMVVRHGGLVSVALPGSQYGEFQRDGRSASFRITDKVRAEPAK
jgi:hypothetical protein